MGAGVGIAPTRTHDGHARSTARKFIMAEFTKKNDHFAFVGDFVNLAQKHSLQTVCFAIAMKKKKGGQKPPKFGVALLLHGCISVANFSVFGTKMSKSVDKCQVRLTLLKNPQTRLAKGKTRETLYLRGLRAFFRFWGG